MPEKETIRRARKDKRDGKSASTQAGEFVREEMHHIREGKHGARSAKQAIAIGLSKARRAGVELSPPEKVEGGSAHRRSGMLRRRSSAQARSRASGRAMPFTIKGSATTSDVATRGTARRNWLT